MLKFWHIEVSAPRETSACTSHPCWLNCWHNRNAYSPPPDLIGGKVLDMTSTFIGILVQARSEAQMAIKDISTDPTTGSACIKRSAIGVRRSSSGRLVSLNRGVRYFWAPQQCSYDESHRPCHSTNVPRGLVWITIELGESSQSHRSKIGRF